MLLRPQLADTLPAVAAQQSRRSSTTENTLNPASAHRSTGTSAGDKPICSGNGVSVSILLAEPVIYLVGLDHDGTTTHSSSNSAAILRGRLQMNVTKSAKIKALTMKFTGRARTEWPEGIPPAKSELFEEESLKTQHMPFFNAMFEGSDTGYGALCNYALRDKSATSSVTNLSIPALDTRPSSPVSSGFSMPMLGNRSNRSSMLSVNTAKDMKRLSLQSNQSRSFGKGDSSSHTPTPAQKGYKIFHPGVYEYPFEIPIDNNSPETTNLQLASVKWQLEVLVERAGTFRANLQGFKEIPVVRSPSEDSLELVEPISISRKWEDQLHYEIMISGKSFPLGSKIPIAFKLTPLAKVQVHKIKVYVSENLEYFTSNRKVTRKDITRKILLIEKSAGKPLAKEYAGSEVRVLAGGEPSPEERERARAFVSAQRQREAARTGCEARELEPVSENMLGDIDLGLETFWTQTEIEMNVQLPTCEMMARDKTKLLHHDCTWKNVNTHHWIKIVMRISRQDADDPTGKKRRHFEISIDSPFSILNCRATQANLALPEYSGAHTGVQSQQHVCGCPNAAAADVSPASSNGSVPTLDSIHHDEPARPEIPMLARPPQAHLSTNAAAGVQRQHVPDRPIHLLRNPSYAPPGFDDEQPPPPVATPPPMYDVVIGTPSHDGLADYFTRMSEYYDDEDQTDDEDSHRAATRGRVNVANPRTPGGRMARSMDIDRSFMFNPSEFDRRLVRERGESGVPAT
ncbi:arrestin-related trafficking adapter C2D10.04 [Phlyctema vagabunda]|uniref:Arrestin-related trafficking adapter C2D10.04 n=1 Tax=Phlyctema vagabunda TaxID=108571 RepID=A0ABR4PRG7_9HELO